jgi:hypothetical protein
MSEQKTTDGVWGEKYGEPMIRIREQGLRFDVCLPLRNEWPCSFAPEGTDLNSFSEGEWVKVTYELDPLGNTYNRCAIRIEKR